MSICIDRFRETVTPPNALMSLMSGKEMRFQVPPVKRSDSTAGSRNESGSESQTVGPPLRKLECQKYFDKTAEYSVCDGWPNGDVGGRKLRRLACSSRRGTLELGTEDTDEQSRQACKRKFYINLRRKDHLEIEFTAW